MSAIAVLALIVAVPAIQSSGADFTAHIAGGQVSASTAELQDLAGVVAQRDGDFNASVSWNAPLRPDVPSTYEVHRTIGDGGEELIQPQPVITESEGRVGFTDDLRIPSTIEGEPVDIVDAGFDANYSCAVAGGRAYCWGTGGSGQLGNGSTQNSSVPVPVKTEGTPLAGKTVTAISAGYEHACAVAGGQVFCWGNQANGRLGNGETAAGTVSSPVAAILQTSGDNVTEVSAGFSNTCALTESGKIWCWGQGERGGSAGTRGSLLGAGPSTNSDTRLPVRVRMPTDSSTATDVAVGLYQACAVIDGGAWCWGSDNSLGTNDRVAGSYEPVEPSLVGGLPAAKTVTDITVGSAGNVCLISAGALYCWGPGGQGRLGTGDEAGNRRPAPVAVDMTGALQGATATSVSFGFSTACAIAERAGQQGVYCWGDGSSGQLGTDPSQKDQSSVPIVAALLPAGSHVDSLSARGFTHACAVVDGTPYCWGASSRGQLGNPSGSTMRSVAPLGAASCPPQWDLGPAGQRCYPGQDVLISYRIDYTKAGWSPPGNVVVGATLN